MLPLSFFRRNESCNVLSVGDLAFRRSARGQLSHEQVRLIVVTARPYHHIKRF